MSEFIYDQIYGSEAKRQKIMQTNKYLYYRQMMRIKDRHIANRSLYDQLYEAPPIRQTVTSATSRRQNLFVAMNSSNYSIQKINTHAFKIIRGNSVHSNRMSNKMTISKWAEKKGYLFDGHKKLSARTIQNDAKRLRDYLQTSQSKRNISTSRVRNLSIDMKQSRITNRQNNFKVPIRQSNVNTLTNKFQNATFNVRRKS